MSKAKLWPDEVIKLLVESCISPWREADEKGLSRIEFDWKYLKAVLSQEYKKQQIYAKACSEKKKLDAATQEAERKRNRKNRLASYHRNKKMPGAHKKNLQRLKERMGNVHGSHGSKTSSTWCLPTPRFPQLTQILALLPF
jgi:hypothetical protein